MSPESPSPREELEAKLTALLLGELPAGEATALREKIGKDAALAMLYARLEHTIGLVRETAATPANQAVDQPVQLKLSDERREKLLARFKTIAPREFKRPQRQVIQRLVSIAAVVALLLLISSFAIPNFVRSKSISASNVIVNNLRQIEAAKQQWAVDNNKSAGDQPTSQELAAYLRWQEGRPP